jgi:hypothetical protein
VHEIPRPERPFLLLYEKETLTRENEEVFLVGLRVVHPARLSGGEHRQGDAQVGEALHLQIGPLAEDRPVGLEDAPSPERLVGQPGGLPDLHHEPPLGDGR